MGGARHYKIDTEFSSLNNAVSKAYKILDNCASGYDTIEINFISSNHSLVFKAADTFNVNEISLQVKSSTIDEILHFLKSNNVDENSVSIENDTITLIWISIGIAKELISLPLEFIELEIRPFIHKNDLDELIQIINNNKEPRVLIKWGDGNINWLETGVPGYNYLSLFINYTLAECKPGLIELIVSVNYKLSDIEEIIEDIAMYSNSTLIYLYDE